MRDDSVDRTIERNGVQKWRFLMQDYEQIKAGQSETSTSIGAFHRHNGAGSQTFRTYRNR